MTAYYCNLAADFTAGRDGTNSSTELATGPGGLQIAIRGGGGATGEFKTGGLAAGDVIYLAGTASLKRLVLLDCDGTDVSAWEIGDAVADNNTGAEWTGKVVQERDNVATGLAADDMLLVQVNSSYSIDSITLASGINNTSKTATSTLAAKTCPGILFTTNSGSATAGWIKYIGVEGTGYTVDGTLACLDMDSYAENCCQSVDSDRLWLENIELKRAGTAKSGIHSANGCDYWVFNNVYAHNCASYGWSGYAGSNGFNYSLWFNCRADSNAYGVGGGSGLVYGCKVTNNTTTGTRFYNGYTVANSLLYGNADGIDQVGAGQLQVLNTVLASNTSDGVTTAAAMIVAIGVRATNNGAYGITETNTGTILTYCVYAGDNVTADISGTVKEKLAVDGVTKTHLCVDDSAVEDTLHGYVSPGNPNYDYNLDPDTATYYNESLVID